MTKTLDPMTPVFFWMLVNRPGAVHVGTQKEWDWWNTDEWAKGYAPHLIHEGLALNFRKGVADWSWWPVDVQSVFGPEWDEDTGPWPIEPSDGAQALAKALGCPFAE
jgi:hypothetical protein